MDCRTFHRKLEDYLEGGLDFAGRFGMERHAKQCYACEKEINTALSLRHMARELRKVGAPLDFEQSLHARIQDEESRRRSWKIRNLWLRSFEGFSWRLAGVTALVTVLLVGTATYLHFQALAGRQASSQAATGYGAGPVAGKEADRNQAAADASALGGLSALDLANFSRFGRDNWAIPYADPRDSEFVDIVVPGPDGQQLIMQLPRTIRMRYAQPSREYFIRNVSH